MAAIWVLFFLLARRGETATLKLLKLGVEDYYDFLGIIILLRIFLVLDVYVLCTELILKPKELVFLNTYDVVPNLGSYLTE